MKNLTSVLLSLLCIITAVLTGGCGSSEPEIVQGVQYHYDNDADVPDKPIDYTNFYGGTNESCAQTGMKSMSIPLTGELFRKADGRYYTVTKLKGKNGKTAYGFAVGAEGYDDTECHYCIEKLYSFDECHFTVDTTTAEDVAKLFPYEEYEGLKDKNTVAKFLDLQFTDRESRLVFEEKDGKLVLSEIMSANPTLVLAKLLLPKDLALITE